MSVESPSAPLRFEEVCFAVAGRQILSGVSAELTAGRVFGLLGANGAGKTTLLRIATRVARPSAGRVWLGGTPLESLSRRELARRLAIVPQDTSVPFPFSVEEVVLMGRAPHQRGFGFDSREDLERAAAALSSMEIEHLAARSILEISGGERQLVMLARAFAQQPEVLLLDEATAFLDLRHRVAVLRAVREFASSGGAVLLVSHDLGLAARACDEVALLQGGRIRESGSPSEVLTASAIRETFGVAAEVFLAPDGSPLVIPALNAEDPPTEG